MEELSSDKSIEAFKNIMKSHLVDNRGKQLNGELIDDICALTTESLLNYFKSEHLNLK